MAIQWIVSTMVQVYMAKQWIVSTMVQVHMAIQWIVSTMVQVHMDIQWIVSTMVQVHMAIQWIVSTMVHFSRQHITVCLSFGLEVQVHHLISLGGWNDVIHLSIYHMRTS
jgi:hypothetical protein